MLNDRDFWRRVFTKAENPAWPCPACKVGTLVLDGKTLHEGETARIRRAYKHEDNGPPMYDGRFSCLMTCNRPECRETVSVAGDAAVDECYDERGYPEWVNLYTPRFFNPAPQMIHVPKGCPEIICAEVRAAFSLYWNDLSSCLNRIRVAVELLLTEMGIKRHGQKEGGGRTRLSLHSRIDILRSKQLKLSDLCDALLAVKWLGNEGSHPGKVRHNVVFDAFDILEYVLRERFEKPQSVIAKMSKAINKVKGPRKTDMG